MSSTEIKDEKNIKIDENLQEIINKIKKEKNNFKLLFFPILLF